MEYWFNGIFMEEDVCKELQKKYNGVTNIKYSKNADGLCTFCLVLNAKNEEDIIVKQKMCRRIFVEDMMDITFDFIRNKFHNKQNKKQKERSK